MCPKDVNKMLLQQARTVYWKKWAAKHEHEELKEGLWLELALALLRKKTKEVWTEKHRNVARKLFLEGGWVQKRLLDIGWSGERKCQASHKRGVRRKAQALSTRLDGFHKVGAVSGNFKEGVEVAQGYGDASTQ